MMAALAMRMRKAVPAVRWVTARSLPSLDDVVATLDALLEV